MTRILVGLACIAALAQPARADDRPWAAGVSDEQQAAALKLLDSGNALFLDKKYAEALDAYMQAIAVWDHPAIRFNIVRCLIQLDRPVEASENLQLALKYGAAPLQDTVYAEALAYQKLLANQTGDLEMTCTQPGVAVRLDGKPVGTCPLTQARRVEPGTHQVVATKDGFLTRTSDVVVVGGKLAHVAIQLDPVAKAARITHRWPAWAPWTVFGSGLALAAIGGVVKLKSVSDMDSYDGQVARECGTLACDPVTSSSIAGLRSSARVEGQVAVGMFAAGAVGVLAGGVMLYLNRPRTVYPSAGEQMVVGVVPLVGGAAIAASGSF